MYVLDKPPQCNLWLQFLSSPMYIINIDGFYGWILFSMIEMYHPLTCLLYSNSSLWCLHCGHMLFKQHLIITLSPPLTFAKGLSPYYIFVKVKIGIDSFDLLQQDSLLCVNTLCLHVCVEISLFCSILIMCLFIIFS